MSILVLCRGIFLFMLVIIVVFMVIVEIVVISLIFCVDVGEFLVWVDVELLFWILVLVLVCVGELGGWIIWFG